MRELRYDAIKTKAIVVPKGSGPDHLLEIILSLTAHGQFDFEEVKV